MGYNAIILISHLSHRCYMTQGRNFILPPVISSLLGRHILLGTLFSKTVPNLPSG